MSGSPVSPDGQGAVVIRFPVERRVGSPHSTPLDESVARHPSSRSLDQRVSDHFRTLDQWEQEDRDRRNAALTLFDPEDPEGRD